jgi:poly-gamma-glutamate synthesis protein (capsule biosynthesis protein)
MGPSRGGDRERERAAPGPAGTARALFVGDIMTHAAQLKRAATADGYDFVKQFARIRPYLRGGLAVGNLETTFSGEKAGFAGYPAFNTPDELASAISGLGVRVVSLANNHILDRGYPGIARTLEVLDKEGILWTGVSSRGGFAPGEPLLAEYGGLRWAFVNFTYGTNLPGSGDNGGGIGVNLITEEAVKESLAAAKGLDPDVTVALFHWGIEYEHAPTAAQTRLAELSAAEGADLVIGTHPHVLQPIEVIPTEKGHALVAYSLGNFVANQIKPPRERTAVLAVEFERSPRGGARLARASVAPVFVSSACTDTSGCVTQLLYGGPERRPGGADPAGPPPPGPPPSASPDNPAGPAGPSATAPSGPASPPAQVPGPASASHPGPFPGSSPAASPYAGASPGSSPGSAPAAVAAASASAASAAASAIKGGAGAVRADSRSRTGMPSWKWPGEAAPSASPSWDLLPEVPDAETAKAREAGERILDFLGARGEPDEFGYYTVWEASVPDVLPEGRRPTP